MTVSYPARLTASALSPTGQLQSKMRALLLTSFLPEIASARLVRAVSAAPAVGGSSLDRSGRDVAGCKVRDESARANPAPREITTSKYTLNCSDRKPRPDPAGDGLRPRIRLGAH